MLRRTTFHALALAGLTLMSRAATADPVTLADSTRTDSWTLANGLEVVIRDVPASVGVAITLAYDVGSDQDPPGREGLGALTTEAAFTGAAGDQPERTRDEMASLRPLGWEIKTTRRLTELTEVASVSQFPGVLHQVANRMRRVTVTDKGLKVASATVKRSLERSWSTRPDVALPTRLLAVAVGMPAATAERYATGKGLAGIGVKDVQQRITALYVPANAVLSIAGNLGGIDVRRLVEGEFGGIPSGTKSHAATHARPAPARSRLSHPGLSEPFGALGVIAPALADSLHPSFYLHALLFGSFVKTRWLPPAPPLTSRFQYVLFDEPDLAIFYPPVSIDARDTLRSSEEFAVALREMPGENAEVEVYDRIRRGAGWLLGAPFPLPLLRRARSEPGMLLTLASSMAARATWGDETFWASYRRRFDQNLETDWVYWRGYFAALKNQVEMRLLPGGKPSGSP
jgi:hypothetical protein